MILKTTFHSINLFFRIILKLNQFIDAYCKIAFLRTQFQISKTAHKISNIFRATKIKDTNDVSIDTVADLTNSKSAGDQVRMQVEWLAKNNFSNQGRQIVKVEKNFYDVVKTNKGKRYFKLKIHQIF